MKKRKMFELAVSAILGFLSIAIPVYLDPSAQPIDGWVFSYFQLIVEKMNSISFPFLALVGFLVAYYGQAPFWLDGAATMLLFPIVSLVDMILGSLYGRSDHNLFPVEWFIYGLISLFGVFGALCGRGFRKMIAYYGRK